MELDFIERRFASFRVHGLDLGDINRMNFATYCSMVCMIPDQICDRTIARTNVENRAVSLQRRKRFVPESKHVATVIVGKEVG